MDVNSGSGLLAQQPRVEGIGPYQLQQAQLVRRQQRAAAGVDEEGPAPVHQWLGRLVDGVRTVLANALPREVVGGGEQDPRAGERGRALHPSDVEVLDPGPRVRPARPHGVPATGVLQDGHVDRPRVVGDPALAVAGVERAVQGVRAERVVAVGDQDVGQVVLVAAVRGCKVDVPTTVESDQLGSPHLRRGRSSARGSPHHVPLAQAGEPVRASDHHPGVRVGVAPEVAVTVADHERVGTFRHRVDEEPRRQRGAAAVSRQHRSLGLLARRVRNQAGPAQQPATVALGPSDRVGR